MGEMITEPSMEEILSSIKRIIAEEGDGPGRGRRLNRPDPAAPREPDPEVLDLNDRIDVGEPEQAYAPEPEQNRLIDADADMLPEAEPLPPAPTEPAEHLLSPATEEASRGPLEALSRVAAKPMPEPSGDGALESVVREMLRPMLRDWLDANLPAMVEKMVAGEIARITGRPR